MATRTTCRARHCDSCRTAAGATGHSPYPATPTRSHLSAQVTCFVTCTRLCIHCCHFVNFFSFSPRFLPSLDEQLSKWIFVCCCVPVNNISAFDEYFFLRLFFFVCIWFFGSLFSFLRYLWYVCNRDLISTMYSEVVRPESILHWESGEFCQWLKLNLWRYCHLPSALWVLFWLVWGWIPNCRTGRSRGAIEVCLLFRVGFLPWQKLFLPGQWKKPWQKLAKTGKINDTINW